MLAKITDEIQIRVGHCHTHARTMTAVGLRNRRGGGVNSHTITETAYEFTGGRRGRYGRRGVAGGASSGETNACCGFLVGLVFFAASTALLWWNEGEAVAVYTSLKEARDAVVALPEGARASSGNKGSLVHVVGATSGDTLADPDFGVVYPDAVKLTRKSETYQWVERTHKRRIREDEHRTRVETSYTYDTRWREGSIRSSNFRYPHGHANPGPSPFDSRTYVAREVGVGDGFTLTPTLVDELDRAHNVRLLPMGASERDRNGWEPRDPRQIAGRGGDGDVGCPADRHRRKGIIDDDDDDEDEDEDEDRFALESRLPEMPVAIRAPLPDGWTIRGGVVYSGSDSAATTSPLVGDRRVAFSAVPGKQTVSVLAKQGKNGSLRPWTSPSGRRVAIVRHGRQSPNEMIASAERANAWKTWGLRALGFIVMIIASALIVSPVREIVSYLRWIPLVGGFAAGVVNLGVSMAAATATVVCACGVIGTSWLAHRPALAYTLFAVSAGSYAWAWASGSRRREAERAADAYERRSTNGAGDGGGDSPGGDSPREGRDGGPEPDYTPPHLD